MSCCRAFFDNDIEHAGEQIVRFFLSLWEDPTSRRRLLAIVKSAVRYEAAATMLREFLSREIVGTFVHALDTPDAELRATLVGSQLIGLAMARYVVKLPPLATASTEAIVAAYAPTIQRYINGPFGRRSGQTFPLGARRLSLASCSTIPGAAAEGWRRSRSCTACCTRTGMNWVTRACSYRAASSKTAACTSLRAGSVGVLARELVGDPIELLVEDLATQFLADWHRLASAPIPSSPWGGCTCPRDRDAPARSSLMLPDRPVDRHPQSPLVHLNFTQAPGDSPQSETTTGD